VLDQQGSATLADNVEVSSRDGAKLTFVTVADWAATPCRRSTSRSGSAVTRGCAHPREPRRRPGPAVHERRVRRPRRRRRAWGLYFADAGQHLEHRLLVDHSVPDCRSYVGYRGALQGDGAHTIWVGDVLIRAEATGTDTMRSTATCCSAMGPRGLRTQPGNRDR
jgi:Fe-S cluster assembly protein SufD